MSVVVLADENCVYKARYFSSAWGSKTEYNTNTIKTA
jgi:hypothetical protein